MPPLKTPQFTFFLFFFLFLCISLWLTSLSFFFFHVIKPLATSVPCRCLDADALSAAQPSHVLRKPKGRKRKSRKTWTHKNHLLRHTHTVAKKKKKQHRRKGEKREGYGTLRLDTRTIHHIIATTLDNVNARRPIQQGKRERQRRRKSATEKKKMSAPSTASFFLFSSVLLFSLSTVGAKIKKKLTVPILQPHTHTHYIPLASGNKKKKRCQIQV